MRRIREQAVEVAEGVREGVFRMGSIYSHEDQNCIKKRRETKTKENDRWQHTNIRPVQSPVSAPGVYTGPFCGYPVSMTGDRFISSSRTSFSFVVIVSSSASSWSF